MSETWKIVLTASITIGGGITVYALSRLFVALYIEPIHRLRSLIGEIADSLVFYANVYCNPGSLRQEIMDEASEILRRQASQLRARAYAIPFYSLWAFMRLVQGKTKIAEASEGLIYLSNALYKGDPSKNHEEAQKIQELLGIVRSAKRDANKPINGRMLSYGILFFLFSMVLLGLPEGTLTLFGRRIFTFPAGLYDAFGIIALVISVVFIVAVFRQRMATKLEEFLVERSQSRWQSLAQYLYFVVFWFVYTIGWLRGLSVIPAGELIFHVAFWFGAVLFFIIPSVFIFIPLVNRIKAKHQL